MSHADHHPTDDELLLAIDGELSSRRQAAIEGHLSRCEMCRTRSAHIDRSAKELEDVCARDLEMHINAAEPARARLQSSLRQLSGQREKSWDVLLSSAFVPKPRWLFVPAGLMAAAALMLALQPWARVDSATTDLSLERDALPVASLTPGASSGVSAEELCGLPASDRRPIPAAMRKQVLHDYRMEQVPSDEYELDYLITPELGGATDARNLWPQRYSSRAWNAHVKDQLERLLPAMVCSGQLQLKTAQQDIARNWIAAYQKYFNTRGPVEPQVRLISPFGRGPGRVVSARTSVDQE